MLGLFYKLIAHIAGAKHGAVMLRFNVIVFLIQNCKERFFIK